MRKIRFVWNKGLGKHNDITEIVEFEDETTDEEITKEFEDWVWEQIGDQFGWDAVEE